MQRAVDYLRGSVRVAVKCRYPERIVNICAVNGVDFKNPERLEDGTVLLTVSIGGYRILRDVAANGGVISVKPFKRRGVPFMLWRIRKRYILIAGMMLCLLAIFISSFFIWQIDVSGNVTVPTSEILAALKSLGVDIGKSTFAVQQARLSNEMMLMIPELKWITLNTHGSRIEVLVREETPKPELIDPNECRDVIAVKAGIITKMTVLNGAPQIAVGDAVAAGDVLVSGAVPGNAHGFRYVNAAAEIWAQTRYEMSLEMPLDTYKKEYTGRSKTKTALILGGKRINLYFSGGNPYTCYDKITMYNSIKISESTILPVTVIKETYEEYERISRTATSDSAEKVLSARLVDILEREIGDGYIISTDFVPEESNGALKVTMYADCVEQIGRAVSSADE